MKWWLALAVLLIVFIVTSAHALPRGSGLICPQGSPSPDGSSISPLGVGQTSCTLADGGGFRYQYQAATLFRDAGSGFFPVSQFLQFQINSGAHAYALVSCNDGPIWLVSGSNGFAPNAIDPSHPPQALKFTDTTRSFSQATLDGLMTSGTVQANDTIVVGTLYADGVPPVWYSDGRLNLSGLTVDVQAPIGCTTVSGNAVLAVDNTAGPVSGLTITSTNGLGEIAFAHDPDGGDFRGVNLGTATNNTVSNFYIHDNDFGIQATSVTTGSNSLAITDITLDHNGNNSSGGASPSHNVYLTWASGTTNTDTVTVSGGGSYCTNGHDGGGAGFMFKTRWPAGTFQNWTAAEPSQHGFTDCAESAAVDFSCGGAYVLGGTTLGTGVVLEVGPNLQNSAGVIRYAQEINIAVNCPSGGWATSSLLVQGADSSHKCWIINDSGVGTVKVVANAAGSGVSVTVKNCNMVGIASGAFGNNVIDGGGNTFFANRAAAGLAAFPALPAPT